MKKQYPVTLSLIQNHAELVNKIFLDERPHKGYYIGACELEGSFLCESPGELFDAVVIGERLILSADISSKALLPPLFVTRADGTELGKLPFDAAILPNILISRGIPVWCHAEAKVFNGGMLEIAVSVYSDNY